MLKFKPGDKVVCVRSLPFCKSPERSGEVGKVYVVTSCTTSGVYINTKWWGCLTRFELVKENKRNLPNWF